jgi:hypothetical protein
MTAGVKEYVDGARFLDDVRFVLDNLGELFRAAVVYPVGL